MATLSWFQTWDSDGGFVGFRRDDLKADKPISMVGGKLYRNGVRFRICGEHLSNGCAGPDDAGEAAGLAQRWAGLGFNMARWLSFDSSTSANESLWVWNVGTPTLSTIDATFVDRMDKLLYELKERGIYAWLTFGQQRRVYAQAGAATGSSNTNPWYGLDWHPTLTAYWKAYISARLTHVNPYTGLTWAEDPAVAVIEFTNENGVGDGFQAGAFDDIISGTLAPWYGDMNALWITSYAAQIGGAPPNNRIPTEAEFATFSATQKQAWYRFMNGLETAWASDMYAFVKGLAPSTLVVTGEHNYTGPEASYIGDGVSVHNYKRGFGGTTGSTPFTANNVSEMASTNGSYWGYSHQRRHPSKFFCNSERGINGLNAFDFELGPLDCIVQSLQDTDGSIRFNWSNNRSISTSAGIVGDLRTDGWPTLNLVELACSLAFRGNYIAPLSSSLTATFTDSGALGVTTDYSYNQANRASSQGCDISAFRYLSISDGSEWAFLLAKLYTQLGAVHSLPSAASYNTVKDANIVAGYQATAGVYIKSTVQKVTEEKCIWLLGSGVDNQTATNAQGRTVQLSGLGAATRMAVLATSLDGAPIYQGRTLLVICQESAPTDAAGWNAATTNPVVTSYGTGANTRINVPAAFTFSAVTGGKDQTVYGLTADGAIAATITRSWDGTTLSFTTSTSYAAYLIDPVPPTSVRRLRAAQAKTKGAR